MDRRRLGHEADGTVESWTRITDELRPPRSFNVQLPPPNSNSILHPSAKVKLDPEDILDILDDDDEVEYEDGGHWAKIYRGLGP